MIVIEEELFRADELASFIVMRPTSLGVESLGWKTSLKFHKALYNHVLADIQNMEIACGHYDNIDDFRAAYKKIIKSHKPEK